MWFPTLLLAVAFASVMADVQEEIDACKSVSDSEDFQSMRNLIYNDELERICPAIIGLMNCVEGVVMNATGLTLEQLKPFLAGTEGWRFITVSLNIKYMFLDLCNEDSNLNKDYKANSYCYKSIATPDNIEMCERQAKTAYEVYKALEDNVQEAANSTDGNRECMIQAYKAACEGTQILEKCGQHAFDTYMQIMKRSTVFKYGICNETQLETVKTKFFNSLELDSIRREQYRLAFDFKKRK